jgi:tRNA modification GTPase
MDTIAAVCTPPGGAERGAIRVSGPRAAELVRATVRCPEEPGLKARGAFRGRFDDGRGEQPVLLLWMPAPHSYTREDVAELHLPGSPFLIGAALERLIALGARPAGPGEFTRRAFEHGRLDLTRAEGVLALVEAANEDERRSATALLFGGLAERVDALRAGLEELRALCEASLDFDETDTGHVPEAELERLASEALARVEEAAGWEERREPLSGLPRIALVGAPNAGKSSLFNRLARGGGRALVSTLAGTTRDGVAAVWTVAGVECRLVDLPGFHDARGDARANEPDRLAQELAREVRAGADLLLWVVDGAATDEPALRRERAELPSGTPHLLIWNKSDLTSDAPSAGADVGVSARTGEGLEALEAAAATALGLGPRGPASEARGGAESTGGLGRELSVRHRHALEASARELRASLGALRAGAPLDLVAESLRVATDALDDVSGRTTPEDLLDRIFARFCLGK